MTDANETHRDHLGQALINELIERGISDPEEFADVFADAILAVVPEAAEELRETLERAAPKMLNEHAALQEEFEGRLYERWKPGLDLLDQTITMASELGDECWQAIAAHSETGETTDIDTALMGLHVRGCRVAREIRCLLGGGFAAGALSRWRTLHELAVVATFLAKHGEQVAERYLLHAIVMSRKDLRQYEASYETLGFQPIAEEDVQHLEANERELRDRFGKDFLSPYGWAADALGIRRPNFTQISDDVELDHYRPFTKLANHAVHAGVKGNIWSLATPEGYPNYHAGPTNFGLADPGQLTCLSLAILTTVFAVQNPTVDRLAVCQALIDLAEDAGHEFVDIQAALEAEHEKCMRDDF